MTNIRTRFAPSPTGYLHVGSARTALYAYLYAKHCDGKFVLRIEDTDQERSTQASVQAILEGMAWLGLDYDEGPFYQTQRLKRYLEVADQLVAQQKAYRCYCSKQRLETLRQTQIAHKQKPKYDQFCLRHANNTEWGDLPYVIRFINPTDGQIVFNDAVHGETVFHNTELDDLILVRSDGVPTYNFCVVVDDWDMQITHVIRGDDHLNNTPRQINILTALGAKIPVYAHIPMILGVDGKRLSKRHGAVDIMQFKKEGFLPAALLNYLVRLGWSAGDQEIFSMAELIRLFDLHQINKSAASMNLSKLTWLNQHYLKTTQISLIKSAFESQLAEENININIENSPDILKIISIQRERCKTLKEMAEKSRFFYEDIIPTPELQQKFLTSNIESAVYLFSDLINECLWTEDHIQGVIQETVKRRDIKLGDFAQAMRVILTGSTVSPPLNSTVYVLGKEKVLARIRYFIP